MPHTASHQAARRRTFAIISHPDAGKTTLTEKMLLYSGAIEVAGSVRDRRSGRTTTSDWLDIEARRGISVSSTVIRFDHSGMTLNLLDTPGHRDFSEDTYRVLSAADSAIMVLDAAKGVERQTLRLFEVCRTRGVPLLTFVNKCDRPGPGPLAILDDIEASIGVRPTPITWPVGDGRDFIGVVDRRRTKLIRFTRAEHGATRAHEQVEDLSDGHGSLDTYGPAGIAAHEELALLDEIESNHNEDTFRSGETTPVFFGSALWNFGIWHILDAITTHAPSPSARPDACGMTRDLDAALSGFIFKIQANMDRNHRDHVAFMRICSGVFDRGMTLVHEPSGRSLSTKYANSMFGQGRESLERAYPGDIIGLVNPGDIRIGDTLYASGPVTYPPIPTFAPEHFMTARNCDTGRHKQFQRGLEQLDREGVVQVLSEPDRRDVAPVLAAVGPLQFDVAGDRLGSEFGAPVKLTAARYTQARQTDAESAAVLRSLRSVDVLSRPDGTLFALFDSNYVLNKTIEEHPDLTLRNIVVS